MASMAIRLLAEPVRTLNSAAIGPAYMGIGTAFDHPIRIIVLQNFTDITLMFSFDGINDHLPLMNNGYMVLDVTGNRTSQSGVFCISEGTRIYVRETGGILPISGDVYVSTFYGYDI